MDIKEIDGALLFVSGMNIDADGSPHAYKPGGGGLDALGNAGSPGNWFGVVTDTGERDGEPVVQGSDDPAPGYYISPTALSDHSKPSHDPTKYVDSSAVPYISIPPELKQMGVKLGDLCTVFYKDMFWGGIVSDIGPHKKFGEASICMAEKLGINSSPRHGGVDKGVTYLIFPGTSIGWPRPNCEQDALDAFNAFGGLEKLKSLDLI
jgi:hypothetical protein